MSELAWQLIDTAPMDGTHVLLFGRQRPHEGLNAAGEIVFSGYWDSIDGAWCSTGSTWEGPFYDPYCWMPLPDRPSAESAVARFKRALAAAKSVLPTPSSP